MKIDCIIVEDEPLALERVKDYVLKLSFLNLVATFDKGMDAFVFLKSNKVDLVLLDINVGDISGIQLLEAAKIDSQIVIITAHHEYALKSYELNVTDYLLKPYTFERFMKAIERVQNNLSKNPPATDKAFVFIKTEYRLEKVMFEDVLYIEGMRDYRKIHCVSRQIMTLQTFAGLEQEIPSDIICRVHKSYMVAIDKIESIERDIIKLRGIMIPISDTFKKRFFEVIKR